MKPFLIQEIMYDLGILISLTFVLKPIKKKENWIQTVEK